MSDNSFDDEKKSGASGPENSGENDYFAMFTSPSENGSPEQNGDPVEGEFQEPYSYPAQDPALGRAGGVKAEQSGRVMPTVEKDTKKKSGCMGGVLYFVFVVSISVILACLVWMAASDVLALNKEVVTSEITIPEDIFTERTHTVTNADGTTKEETYDSADMGKVASLLKDAGIIQYPFLFRLYSNFSNADEKIDPGTYQLSTELDYRAIIKKLHFGSDMQVRTSVTFPEGFTMKQIFERLQENKICKVEDLMDCAANTEFSYKFLENIPMGDASRLEGFLFPDTYEFYEGMTAEAAMDTFLQIFHYKLTEEMWQITESKGLTMRDIVNIASMIEKETSGSADDRAAIASVIYNRLNAGMPLGIDATSLYSHPDHEGAPTADMLADATDPYNTRLNTGLPPTPICNPGSDSITAALKPASTNYYYYALDTATGEHKFFTNSSEFNAFVATQNYD